MGSHPLAHGARARIAAACRLAHLVGRATGQSLTSGNRIEPLIDGEQAYPAMLAAIESARHSVALASYAFDSQGIGARSSSMRCAGLMRAASAATTSASRPSTSCSQRWTASTARSG